VTTSLQLPAAADIHSAIRRALDPIMRPLGYSSRGGGAAKWSAKTNHGKLHLQFQLHPKARDPYQGGRFIVEVEHTLGEGQGRAFSGRARFDQLLTRAELETMVEHQDAVIASLPRPPASHVASYPESLRDTYLNSFEPQTSLTPGDLWLRYQTIDHVQGWLRLISGMLPSMLERAKRLDPHVIYMGSTIDLSADPLQPTSPVVVTQKPAD